MNLLFGAFGGISSKISDSLVINDLQNDFDQDVELTRSSGPSACIGALSDKGVIVGHAASETVSVFIIGSLYQPLPDWQFSATPPSQPDMMASYLLDRYVSLGGGFLENVTGQYAALLIDHSSGTAYLASDPLGMRTWYVSVSENGVLFSSHLQTLAKLIGEDLEFDRSAEDFFLIYGFYPRNGTPYRNVHSMPAGQLLKFENGISQVGKISYADPWSARPQFDTTSINSLDGLTNQLYDAFMTAVEEQSADDKRAAVLLGGVDSALVASALHRLGKQVETFSFSYAESQYNQLHTDTLADYLGTQHHWIHITQDIFSEGLKNFSSCFNQPTNWPNYVIQTAHLSRVMRDAGFNFCYSGDGCDTVFLGYPGTYKRAALMESLPTLPQGVVNLLLNVFGWQALDRHFGHPYRVFLNLLRSLGRKMPARGFVSFRIMDEVGLRQLRRGDPPEQDMTVEQLLQELAEPHRNQPTLRLAYMGKSLVSPNKNKMVGSSDQTGIAIFSPYLHPGLKAFASSLPESLCRPHEKTASSATGKYVLMKMAEDKKMLPPEVIYQPKIAGVDGPIDEWYAGPLKPLVMELLKDLPFESNPEYLSKLADLKSAENWFKNKIMVDNVISHALSLLITYASFTKPV